MFWTWRKKIFKIFAKNVPGNKLRIALYRLSGYHIGKDVYVAEGLIIAEKLEDIHNLIIEDRVAIGPGVMFLTSSDPNFSRIRPYVKTERGKIIIKKDAWIGAGAIILPNISGFLYCSICWTMPLILQLGSCIRENLLYQVSVLSPFLLHNVLQPL